MQKLQDRVAALAKLPFSGERQWSRWKAALIKDLMSSEESGNEGDEQVIHVRPLPWRSEAVNVMFAKLDEKAHLDRSAQAKHQRKRRVPSLEQSSRGKPQDESHPAWLFI